VKPEVRVSIVLEASLAPSEDPEKVIAAMKNVVGDCSYVVDKGRQSARITSTDSRCLVKIRDQLRDRRVRAVARRLLVGGRQGRKTTVMLNRQAAAAGVIALCSSEGESPMGPVYLTIESEDLDETTQWLTAFEETVGRP
jgi:predicted RNA binding protein with dsRBD fold (UPF0201 family)